MAARKTHDLVAVTGSYQNAQGELKKRYQNVGAMMEGENGPFIMLAKWFNPAGVQDERGGESLLLSLFEPQEQSRQAPQRQASRQAPQRQAEPPRRQQPPAPRPANGFDDMLDDDIPF
jgi:hypothetical protein